jgi:hypothetical protein
MTTVFEELPPAISTPYGNGSTIWTANFLATGPEGGVAACTVKAIVHQDKASDIRLKQEQRGNLMCGMLIDARGVVYGISSVYVGGPPDSTGDDGAATSQLDVARARLIDLASTWRRMGTGAYAPGNAVYLACARELDGLVVELLANAEKSEPEVEDGW